MDIVEAITKTDECAELKAQYVAGLVCAFEAANHLIDLGFLSRIGINRMDVQDFDELFEQLFYHFKQNRSINTLLDL